MCIRDRTHEEALGGIQTEKRRDTEQHTGGNRREVQERRHMKRHWGEFRQRRGEKYGKG